MPVEFSVAAYRLGHSMVRPGYRLNETVLLPIFPVPRQGLREGLTGFRAMNPAWGIDWGRFIDVDIRNYDGTQEDQKKRLQFAYRIDTSLVNPLGDLPPAVASNPSSLAQRNLERAWRLGLPSGQSVAHAMRIKPLADRDIIIGKGPRQAGGSGHEDRGRLEGVRQQLSPVDLHPRRGDPAPGGRQDSREGERHHQHAPGWAPWVGASSPRSSWGSCSGTRPRS